MIEKIILAIAITFSLSWSIQVKPPQREVAIEIDSSLETVIDRQADFIQLTVDNDLYLTGRGLE